MELQIHGVEQVVGRKDGEQCESSLSKGARSGCSGRGSPQRSTLLDSVLSEASESAETLGLALAEAHLLTQSLYPRIWSRRHLITMKSRHHP